MSYLKNICIVGGSGQVGSSIVTALVATGKFSITAITRDNSTSTFAPTVNVQRGSYDSKEFLVSALQGQEVLIIALAATAPKGIQTGLIDAAAEANVAYIFPCEFGPDTGNKTMTSTVPFLGAKQKDRDQIEALGKSSWIGFISGLWFDMMLSGGFIGINIKDRTAKFYDDGTTKFSTSTLPRVGRAMAKFLELPTSQIEKSQNNYIRIQSFATSQLDILQSVMRASGSNEKDWTITRIAVETAITEGNQKFAEGDRGGLIDVLVGANFRPGGGGCFEGDTVNELIGLQEEDLDTIVIEIVRKVEAK